MRPTVEFLLGSTANIPFGECFEDWFANRPKSLDMNDDVTFIHNSLTACGYSSLLYFDQTMLEGVQIGIRTVRAIVPGLLPIDFGHGRCRAANLPRLYDVPFRLGRSERPLVRGDINPAPHPFA
jgi:ribosomal protein S12 methylthiotransferase accessory factor